MYNIIFKLSYYICLTVIVILKHFNKILVFDKSIWFELNEFDEMINNVSIRRFRFVSLDNVFYKQSDFLRKYLNELDFFLNSLTGPPGFRPFNMKIK